MTAAWWKTGHHQDATSWWTAEKPDSAVEGRRESSSTMDAEIAEDLPGSGELQGFLGDDDEGASSSSRPVKTGMEHIPSYDGQSPMREYQRRVRLFEASTSIDASFRAQKLMQYLTDQAWRATETLSLETLRDPRGVDRLLEHLWSELEPLEHLRVFSTLQGFYRNFRRGRSQEFVSYDMDFRSQLQRLEEIGAGVTGITKAFWFLEKAGLSPELRKQVVAAAGGQYDYAKLRGALVAIVPQIQKLDDNEPAGGPRTWKRHGGTGNGAKPVHAVQGEDDGEDDSSSEKLQAELDVLLTQAARKRAEVEKSRGFGRSESATERTKRISDMKSRMPCSACKSHGKTVYGHWHSDKECPYYNKEKAVLAVVDEDFTESEEELLPEDSEVHQVAYNLVFSTGQRDHGHQGLALNDTCCAKTVVGEPWLRKHLRDLAKKGIDAYLIDEEKPFRFGGGPKVLSSYAAIFPMSITPQCPVWIRASVVSQRVPLLLSRPLLHQLGAVLDLPGNKVTLRALDVTVDLVETANGLCGFRVDHPREPQRHENRDEWMGLLDERKEVLLGNAFDKPNSRTLGDECFIAFDNPCLQEPLNSSRVVKQASKSASNLATAHSDRSSVFSNSGSRDLKSDSDFQDQHHHECAGSTHQGRVRQRNPGEDEAQPGDSRRPEDRSPEGVVEDGETEEVGSGSTGRMEEMGSRVLEEPVPGHRGEGLSPRRRPLEQMAKESARDGAGVLGSGRCRGQSRGGGARHRGQSHVHVVRDTHDHPHQPDDPGRLLGMCPVPHMQTNAAHEVRSSGHGRDAEVDPRGPDEAREGSEKRDRSPECNIIPGEGHQRNRTRSDKEEEAGDGSSSIHRSKFGQWVMATCRAGADRLRRREPGQEYQHEPRQGGVSRHHEDARGEESGSGLRVDRDLGEGDGLSHVGSDQGETASADPLPKLSHAEVDARIAEGKARRKHLKKGMAKRFLGNMRAAAATAMIAMAAYTGAAAANWFPGLGSGRPDVLEVFAGKAVVSQSFSRWGWNTAEPVDVIYGLA